MSLLTVENLSVVYEPRGSLPTKAVRNVSLRLEQGESVGIVGESGSGKSTLGFAITRLLRNPARIESGKIIFDGKDIAGMTREQLREQRQGGFAMVLQAGMNALNPVRTIGKHFDDIFRAHGHIDRKDFAARAAELVQKVRLDPQVLGSYPGELSGGMRQRVAISLALALEPRLMIFDEPTTALDVLVQHAVMDTIQELQRSENFTAILISHDVGLVMEATERILVMHEGEIVEDSPSHTIATHPKDAYTRMLLSHYADPRQENIDLPGLSVHGERIYTHGTQHVAPQRDLGATEAFSVEHVTKVYPAPKRGEQQVHAVDDVSFVIQPGEALALVGQSGSGKSTIAKMMTGVEKPSSGRILFGASDVSTLNRRGLKELHRQVQMVFQDPYAALNPMHTVEYILSRPLANYLGLRGDVAHQRVLELLDMVGLTPAEEYAAKLPHQLSGGQRQRVVIARALASNPQVIVADEPVSMLDVSLRAGVLGLIADLREHYGVSVLYITHDLLSARMVTNTILVLHNGRVVERGSTHDVMQHPHDRYTKQLLDAIPHVSTQA